MDWSKHPEFDAHEHLHAYYDDKSKLRAFIAVHSTALGPAAGGCRRWVYVDNHAAVTDALRLSKGMSYKNAMAGLPFGGGKAVIMADPDYPKTQDMFLALGEFIHSLRGEYITAEDVGVTTDDMATIHKATPYVSGLPQLKNVAGGDPSPWTALGVYLSIKVAASRVLGTDVLTGLSVGVQGVGNVGYHLCSLLHGDGAKLVVADLDETKARRVANHFGATVVSSYDILFADVDIISPCALGAVLNEKTIPQIRAPIVAGAANNQLASDADGSRLMQKGVLYLPDYVINAGGIISVAKEYLRDSDAEEVEAEVTQIPDRLENLLTIASNANEPTNKTADRMARQLIENASVQNEAVNAA